LHLHAGCHADLFEEFTRVALEPDTIYLPPQHQPINPEDEDDVVPDQHAAFGIAKATKETREPIWRDLRLEELVAGHSSTAGAGASASETAEGSSAQARGATGVEGGSRLQNRNGMFGGVGAVGPATGGVRAPIAVRAGMRAVGGGTGSGLRG